MDAEHIKIDSLFELIVVCSRLANELTELEKEINKKDEWDSVKHQSFDIKKNLMSEYIEHWNSHTPDTWRHTLMDNIMNVCQLPKIKDNIEYITKTYEETKDDKSINSVNKKVIDICQV